MLLPASAREIPDTHTLSLEVGSDTDTGQRSVPIQIGRTLYDCQIDPAQTRSVISSSIYRAQRHTLDLDRLTHRERKAQNLPIRFGERYLSQLPIRINGHLHSLKHAIVSDHKKGLGLCVGVSGKSTYSGTRRSNCGYGIGLKVLFSTKGSASDWCVLGQDVLSRAPAQSDDIL